MILLGDKYDVPELQKEGIKQLCAWYSNDIAEWDHRDGKFFAHEADHLSVAKITHTLHKEDLHAAVLYHCCRLPASNWCPAIQLPVLRPCAPMTSVAPSRS